MVLVFFLAAAPSATLRAQDRGEVEFVENVQPILDVYCVDCHDAGTKRGGLTLDAFTPDQILKPDGAFWWTVLKNVRSGLMPPPGKPRLPDEDLRALEGWIKRVAFAIEPECSTIKGVALRRLNRAEYRNTIRDLTGVDFNATAEFPPDDSGGGFDNIAGVLNVSPLLLEKYLAAARSIISQAVPTTSRIVAETRIGGERFLRPGAVGEGGREGRGEGGRGESTSLSYYANATVSAAVHAEHSGRYELVVKLTATEEAAYAPDYNKCRLILNSDGREVFREEYGRRENLPFQHRREIEWSAGDHELEFVVEPLTPGEKQTRSLAIRIDAVLARGPLDRRFWVRPPGYSRFFPHEPPEDVSERRRYARELLGDFARRAYRRPASEAAVNRLATLAELGSTAGGLTFEAGVAQAMAAVLASPQFLFREERIEEGSSDLHPLLDEYALASRLSYFLWSSTPDEELLRLAERRALRKELPNQLRRMLADPRSKEFVRNFVGQWLQTRDVETTPVNAFDVIRREQSTAPAADPIKARFRALGRRFPDALTDEERRERNRVRASYFKSFRVFREHELNDELRRAMRRETELLFDRIVREDRNLQEVLCADYTYLNEPLARHYGIAGVSGDEMRLVELPPESPRGGVLSQGAVLVVTSNPNRTSPVKRGLFILDNILGTPPPPQPPNVPTLEAAERRIADRNPTMRETLEMHRRNPSCRSCHSRMDPLGLALENFDALGLWRDRDQGRPVESAGRLVSGEVVSSVRDLKRILVEKHARDYFRCLSEKMTTYALGRGLDYHDVETIDGLVERLEREGGRAGALIAGVVESPQFQRGRRPPADVPRPNPAEPPAPSKELVSRREDVR